MNLISSRSGWSSFSVTFSAIHWSASVWFERNFAFLSTFGADCFVHFSCCHLAISTPKQFLCKPIFFAHQFVCKQRIKLIGGRNFGLNAHAKRSYYPSMGKSSSATSFKSEHCTTSTFHMFCSQHFFSRNANCRPLAPLGPPSTAAADPHTCLLLQNCYQALLQLIVTIKKNFTKITTVTCFHRAKPPWVRFEALRVKYNGPFQAQNT
jgi:hypothetical protein